MNMESERRSNAHQQMLVDVGVMLRRCRGSEYARNFLEGMKISELVISRVLDQSAVRRSMHFQEPAAE